MASTFKPRTSVQITTLRLLSGALYTIAILTGFASMYPIYSVYQLFEHSVTVASPLSSLLAAVLLLVVAGLAYLAQKQLDRHINTIIES